MASTVKNLTRRLVSFRGNSGQSWHLAPGRWIELPDVEVAGNPKITKLVAQRALAVLPAAPAKPDPAADEGERGKRPRAGR